MQGGNAQNKKRFIIVSLILILSLALPCFATVTETSGDGYTIYGTALYPDLPDPPYPYTFIMNVQGLVGAFSLPSIPEVDLDAGGFFLPAGTFGALSTFYQGAWTSFSPYTSDGDGTFPITSLIWWGFDVDVDGEVISASPSYDLDGYTVINWDGDITGLEQYVLFYRVADFFDRPSSAYTLYTRNSVPFVGSYVGDTLTSLGSAAWEAGSDSQSVVVRALSDDRSASQSPGLYFANFDFDGSSVKVQTFAYRESETEGPTGAVTGLNIITPPLGETDYIVYAGSELQCTAQVTGTGDFNSAVTWSLSHSSSSSEYYPTISETGLLSVLPGVPEQRIFITATSVADPSIYATVPVYIMPPAVSSVTITPSSATAVPGQNIQFSATVSGSNVEDSAVTWAVGGASSASTRITRDGLLLIGSDEVSPVIAVRATFDQDGSVYGTALVTINVPAAVTGVTITPDDIVLNRGDVQQFTASVSGTGSYDNSVSWQITSVYSAGTSISNTGLLTIGEEQKYDYIIIKATSTADPSFSATAYVFVEDALSDPMNIDLSVVERLLEEIKNYLKTLQHIFDRPHYFREFNMYTGKLNEQEEQITGLTFNFYRFMQNMEEYVGSIAYTFANGAEVQIREDTTEGFDWFSLFFGKDSGSKVEKNDFAGISSLVTNSREWFDTGFGLSDLTSFFLEVPFFNQDVKDSLDAVPATFDRRDPDPYNMSILTDRQTILDEMRNRYVD